MPISKHQPILENTDALWLSYDKRIGAPDPSTGGRLPDFMIVSPVRTATTWLYDKLVVHPGVLLPKEKESRYFDLHWRRQSIDWYAAKFAGGDGRKLGDATPSYALLPDESVATLRRLMPQLKLVFCLREPVSRAWSQVKHSYDYREMNFYRDRPDLFEAVDYRAIVENMIHDYSLSSGDYENVFRRWLRHFPRRQMHVTTVEQLRQKPAESLQSLCEFLGLDAGFDFSRHALEKKSNETRESAIPEAIRCFAEDLYAPRAASFVRFAKAELGLDLDWQTAAPPEAQPVWICDRPERLRIYAWRGSFWALPVALDQGPDADGAALAAPDAAGRFAHAPFMGELRAILAGGDRDASATLETQRLRGLLSELADDYDRLQQFMPMRPLHEYRGFIVFQYAGDFYGLRNIKTNDVVEAISALEGHEVSRDVVKRDTPQLVRDAIDLIVMTDQTEEKLRSLFEQAQGVVTLLQSLAPPRP